jgi:hypothetical protein
VRSTTSTEPRPSAATRSCRTVMPTDARARRRSRSTPSQTAGLNASASLY